MKRFLLSGVALVALPGAALANCPAITVADMQGVAAGTVAAVMPATPIRR